MQEETEREQDRATAPESMAPSSSVPDELGRLAHAVRRLFGAQWHLLAAELGLARSAVSWLLVAALVAIVAGVALSLTLLVLAAVLLATWLQSWTWALVVLALLLALLLLGSIALFRRCLRWMSLPATRHELRATMRETLQRAGHDADGDQPGERKS